MTCATLVARRQCHVEIRDVRARPVVSPRGVPPVDRRPRYRLFTPVITAGSLSRRHCGAGVNSKRTSLGTSVQAELACSGDRRAAVLNTQFAVQSSLVGLHSVQ